MWFWMVVFIGVFILSMEGIERKLDRIAKALEHQAGIEPPAKEETPDGLGR